MGVVQSNNKRARKLKKRALYIIFKSKNRLSIYKNKKVIYSVILSTKN